MKHEITGRRICILQSKLKWKRQKISYSILNLLPLMSCMLEGKSFFHSSFWTFACGKYHQIYTDLHSINVLRLLAEGKFLSLLNGVWKIHAYRLNRWRKYCRNFSCFYRVLNKRDFSDIIINMQIWLNEK